MALFAVRYTYGDDTIAARDEHRPRHVEFLTSLHDTGVLRLSGPIASDDAPGALLILDAETADELATRMDGDPFMQQGLIARREILAWKIVFGQIAD